MRIALLFFLAVAIGFGQQIQRWRATTGDVVLAAAGTTATVQQLAGSAATRGQTTIEQIVAFCSVACNLTIARDGAAATATAGTPAAIAPTPASATVPFTFWTASDVGAGTDQAGIIRVTAGTTLTLCLVKECGNGGDVILGSGAGSNYSATISSITGTANVTFFVRTTS